MYFYGFFQTDVLINIFIPLRQAEAVTWENFVPGKRHPGSTKEGYRLAEMKLFTCNREIQLMITTPQIVSITSLKNKNFFHGFRRKTILYFK